MVIVVVANPSSALAVMIAVPRSPFAHQPAVATPREVISVPPTLSSGSLNRPSVPPEAKPR